MLRGGLLRVRHCRKPREQIKCFQLSVRTYQRAEELMYDTPSNKASSMEARCRLRFLSSVSCIFHGPLKPSHIQFKCKATEEKVFVFAIYSTPASAITESPARPARVCCSTDHGDHASACGRLIDTLDLYLIRMDHSFALFPPLRFFKLFFFLLSSLLSSVIKLCPQMENLNLFPWSVVLFKLTRDESSVKFHRLGWSVLNVTMFLEEL